MPQAQAVSTRNDMNRNGHPKKWGSLHTGRTRRGTRGTILCLLMLVVLIVVLSTTYGHYVTLQQEQSNKKVAASIGNLFERWKKRLTPVPSSPQGHVDSSVVWMGVHVTSSTPPPSPSTPTLAKPSQNDSEETRPSEVFTVVDSTTASTPIVAGLSTAATPSSEHATEATTTTASTAPTERVTEASTPASTAVPTAPTTEHVSDAPTTLASTAPTAASSEHITETSTLAPTTAPTSASTEHVSDAPTTMASTAAPTAPTTEHVSDAPTTLASTAPTSASTEHVTEVPTTTASTAAPTAGAPSTEHVTEATVPPPTATDLSTTATTAIVPSPPTTAAVATEPVLSTAGRVAEVVTTAVTSVASLSAAAVPSTTINPPPPTTQPTSAAGGTEMPTSGNRSANSSANATSSARQTNYYRHQGRLLPRTIPTLMPGSASRFPVQYESIHVVAAESSSHNTTSEAPQLCVWNSSIALTKLHGNRHALANVSTPICSAELCPPKGASSKVPYGQKRIDSTVWITFDVTSDDVRKFGFSRSATANDTRSDPSPQPPMHSQLRRAARFLLVEAMSSQPDNVSSLYHQFFHHRNAKLWEWAPSESVTTNCSAAPTPLQMDVVYTYVNNTSPSHVNATASRLSADPTRFRDWNELQHSMRGVYQYGMCRSGTVRSKVEASRNASNNQTTSGIECDDDESRSLIRKIHLVVAHDDQVPTWLAKPLHSRVNIALHKDTFPLNDASFLPSFNSHAIESTLHRIHGLRRFFVYFNNDMFWGRTVSWFDYFRPLSDARQSHRESLFAGCTRDMVEQGMIANLVVSQNGSNTTSPLPLENEDGGVYRVSLLMEPIVYFEQMDSPRECRVWPKPPFWPINVTTSVTISSNATNTTNLLVPQPMVHDVDYLGGTAEVNLAPPSSDDPKPRCDMSLPTPPSAFFDLQCLKPHRPRAVVSTWRQFVLINKAYVFHRIRGAPWSTHTFAHYPRLMDRHLMKEMLDADFLDVATETRRSKERNAANLWTTHLHLYYALSQRRSVDFDLVVQQRQQANRTWQHPLVNAPDTAQPTRFHLVDLMPDDDIVHNGRFSLEPLRFLSTSETSEARVTRPPPAAGLSPQDKLAYLALHGQHTLMEPESKTSLLEEKLNFHAVRLDRKRGGYYFCMMKTIAIQRRCIMETTGMRQDLGGIQLFITVNDDFPRLGPYESTAERVAAIATDMFQSFNGNVTSAPWEGLHTSSHVRVRD